ncbi:CAZyme family GT22 [Paecilomyces variotii]|nr:CAZyme family GT22 [Paecilomyces variotii]KAJ9237287.1 CAZyme family GT22 [Paecilomyces variotii]
MWRRIYLLLLLVRVYFALSPSYLHPDENFQGPEVFAGRIYSYPAELTWEFTSAHPIRSVFPLWIVYGLPMSVLKWFYNEAGNEGPPPELVYYVLRGVMFVLSFVLEDWAIYELVSSPRHRLQTLALVASSYVTWTYQTHTFSNSLETLSVAWGLVLIKRIVENKNHSGFFSCVVLSFVAVVGVFNRITFPAFLLIPGLQLLPHFVRKPFSVISLVVFGAIFTVIAILTDTFFYNPPSISTLDSLRSLVITPLNNLRYNSNSANLATHGLHPHYQHFLVNFPELLGPVYIMICLAPLTRSLMSVRLRNRRALSAISATIILSIFPHQEARFLVPCIPLLLTCVRPRKSKIFLVAWIIFNAALGFLMGIYHQGGIVPVQLQIPSIVSTNIQSSPALKANLDTVPSATVLWWKTYSPPRWLLGDNSSLPFRLTTRDLMGIPGPDMVQELERIVPSCPTVRKSESKESTHDDPTDQDSVFLVAPRSATFLDQYTQPSPTDPSALRLQNVWTYERHFNLDDLDFGDDGVIPTLKRVFGRRGLNVWAVKKAGCS